MERTRTRRRIFLGDVQGCSVELDRLLDQVGFDPGSDELHPVGDLVNRGPDSAGVLRRLREAGAGGVLGNHDIHLLRVGAGLEATKRRDTFGDVLEASDREALLVWLRRRPLVRVWPDIVLVHAGLHPTWGHPEQVLGGRDPLIRSAEAEFATTVRYCRKDGALPARDHGDPPGPDFAPWFRMYRRPPQDARVLVFGHWAACGLVVEPLLRGLDTGCVWGGKLTAWIAEEDRLAQVPAARAYARPESRPRNLGSPPRQASDS
jgi:bis(5'-nucleosyl)-tetraphosphatase (symmetrical)